MHHPHTHIELVQRISRSNNSSPHPHTHTHKPFHYTQQKGFRDVLFVASQCAYVRISWFFLHSDSSPGDEEKRLLLCVFSSNNAMLNIYASYDHWLWRLAKIVAHSSGALLLDFRTQCLCGKESAKTLPIFEETTNRLLFDPICSIRGNVVITSTRPVWKICIMNNGQVCEQKINEFVLLRELMLVYSET